MNRTATTASGCFEHSSNTDFITITKNACFVCEPNNVSLANGNNTSDICPSDNSSDIFIFQNSLGLSAGTNYVYLLTDQNEILQEVISADQYDFEGSNMNTQRVYGLHFDGTLNAALGFPRVATTATGCFEHSSSTAFISITKNACFVCESSTVSNATGSNSLNICPSDNSADIITFENSLGINAGVNYVYLITDENEILQEVVNVDQFNFEGTNPNTQRVYGIHFDGTLNPAFGQNRTATTASGCFEHSAANQFISINKNACFDCNQSTVSSSNGASPLEICQNDNEPNLIQLVNSLGLPAGDEYVYLLTDENEILQEVVSADQYDFEGSSDATQRVYGMHFDGQINPAIGQNRINTTADGCFEHSSGTEFIEIIKDACFACNISTVSNANGNNSLDICPTDNDNDIVQLQNSLGLSAGNNYVYLLTDENETLIEVINNDQYNFEGSNLETQRIYGLHFDGQLDPAVGANRMQTTATGCFEHSDDAQFISVSKNACFDCNLSSVSNANGNNSLNICPTDNDNDIVQLQNSLGLSAGSNYVYLLTDEDETLIEVINSNQYNFEGSSLETQRIYGIHFDGQLNAAIGLNRLATTATGCFAHSDNAQFISVSKNACFDCNANTVSNANGSNSLDICPTDNDNDIVQLQNSLGLNAGNNYVYLLTDENEILIEVIDNDQYNFEGSSLETQRIYGMHFDGQLNPAVGANRMQTTASECFEHSDGTQFISVSKNACFDCNANTVSNANGSNSLDICPTDNDNDIVQLQNSLGLTAGSNYVYLLTDENEILIEVINNDQYNFEGSSLETQRIYGMHFDGQLNPAIGANRLQTTASDCFEHSGAVQFISVSKNACFDCNANTVSNANGNNSLDICPTDNDSDIVQLQNSLGLSAGSNYVYLLTDENEILIEVINQNQYDFEGSSLETQRIYGLHFSGQLNPAIGANRRQTTARDCFEHSDDAQFIAVSKNACFDCNVSTVSNANGNNTLDICPTDNNNDIVQLQNSLGLNAGNNYVYLLTDENEILIEVINNDQYNFEGSSLETQRIYGLHFDGQLNPVIGANRMQTTASECFEHSNSVQFISVSKNACEEPFECLESFTATTDWASEVDICPSDGVNDIIELRNNITSDIGENYVYLITDAQERLLELVFEGFLNFEGSGADEQRVYGMHYSGTLEAAIGENRLMTTATDCFVHSGEDFFLTITKNACPGIECEDNFTATTDWASEVDICPNDGEDDTLELRNNLGEPAGENYVYLLTDAQEILQEVIVADFYNFEGSTPAEQRVYGLHFDGTLQPAIGQVRTMTTSTGCFTHSGEDFFLTVTKGACIGDDIECVDNFTATTDWATEVDICPNDGEDDTLELRNNIGEPAGENYVYLLTDAQEILQEVIVAEFYNFEGSTNEEQRVYGLHFDGTLQPAIGQVRTMTTSTGCFTHSGGDFFLTITKNACDVDFECQESLTATHGWVTEIDICSIDGAEDNVFLQNNISTPPGENYVFLLTDEFEVLQEVIIDTVYNFENTGTEEQRVYGLSYSGTLVPQIGEDRKNTTASGCFIHSGDNLFIRINKTASCETNAAVDTELLNSISVFPNPSSGLVHIDLSATDTTFDAISLFDIHGKKIQELGTATSFEVSTAGVYLLRFTNKDGAVTKRIVIQ